MSSSWGRRRCAAGALLCAGALAYMPHASGLAAMVSVSAPRFVVAVPPEEKAMRRPSPATVAAASTSLQDLGFVVLRANEGVLDTQLVDSAREEARVDLECMLSRLRKLGFDTDKDSFRCVCWRADVCRDAPHAVPGVRVASLRTQPHADARVRVFAHPPHTHTHTYTHTHTHSSPHADPGVRVSSSCTHTHTCTHSFDECVHRSTKRYHLKLERRRLPPSSPWHDVSSAAAAWATPVIEVCVCVRV